MSDLLTRATFDDESDLLKATSAVRDRGMQIVDAYTPYAVHGLDEAMGIRRSRLTWVCFVLGMLGAAGMLAFQHWVASESWALDVGGKPWNSLPSDVPVAFEAAVLLAGLGTVFALFLVSRMYPGKRAKIVDLRVTDDRFVLIIDRSSADCTGAELEQLLRENNVLDCTEEVLCGKR